MFRALDTLREVGLGYLRLGQPATELSGGEAQRIKLATELQRAGRGHTVYVLDEPTTGLHPADVERLRRQLFRLVEAGHTVIAVEHDMQLVTASDWVIDIGPGAGDKGGRSWPRAPRRRWRRSLRAARRPTSPARCRPTLPEMQQKQTAATAGSGACVRGPDS
ncbi:AAA family ATPase [Deinococcus multiflagellatus]|uniref:UvrABC system protein A n=1 Tax=Deinococcus multiflagellatus TaxID=1656887 RepID=A0ABW1ZUS9_9DEIO